MEFLLGIVFIYLNVSDRIILRATKDQAPGIYHSGVSSLADTLNKDITDLDQSARVRVKLTRN